VFEFLKKAKKDQNN